MLFQVSILHSFLLLLFSGALQLPFTFCHLEAYNKVIQLKYMMFSTHNCQDIAQYMWVYELDLCHVFTEDYLSQWWISLC